MALLAIRIQSLVNIYDICFSESHDINLYNPLSTKLAAYFIEKITLW